MVTSNRRAKESYKALDYTPFSAITVFNGKFGVLTKKMHRKNQNEDLLKIASAKEWYGATDEAFAN